MEYIIREQNILAAYEIIELFCEFVLARVPVLESQRFVILLRFTFRLCPIIMFSLYWMHYCGNLVLFDGFKIVYFSRDMKRRRKRAYWHDLSSSLSRMFTYHSC